MIASMTASPSRVGQRDIAIASVLTLLGVALMTMNVVDHHDDPAQFKENTAVYFGGLIPIEFAIPLFLLVTVPLLWRRVAPLPAVCAALAGLAINELLVGTDVVRCGVVFPTAFVFAFTTGSLLDGPEARKGLALSLGFAMAMGTFCSPPLH